MSVQKYNTIFFAELIYSQRELQHCQVAEKYT